MKTETGIMVLEKRPTTAIEVRRQLVDSPVVSAKLSEVDRLVLEFSTDTPIRQMEHIDRAGLVEKVGALIRGVMRDLGIRKVDDFSATRFYAMLVRYYGSLTLAEVKLAFELSMTGDLDPFLPKNSQGEADRGHYQQFSVEYFTKILNAYRRKQNSVVHVATQALPESKREFSPEYREHLDRSIRSDVYRAFLAYKYSGRDPEITTVTELLIYDKLAEVGLVDEVTVTENDRKQALSGLMRDVVSGLLPGAESTRIRQEKHESEQAFRAGFYIARRREIRAAFDRIIKSEIQLKSYLWE